MAVVGDAFIVVRAITTGVEKDIKNAFKGTDRIGDQAGNDVGRSFQKGFRRNNNGNMFGNLIKQAVSAKERFSSLTRAGYVLQPALAALGGVIGLLGTSLLSLGSIISAATLPTLAVLGQSFTAVAQAAITLKLAFSGVGKAIGLGTKAKKAGADKSKALEKAEDRLTKAQRALADAYEDAATREKKAKKQIIDAEKELFDAREQAIEQLQQIGFESEDAAIAEQKAALELEKARESLARVSDLPPNSRARKEAELAFAQADLNYRKAIDANNDLKKTEAKNAELAKKGPQALVDGQENVVAALAAVDDATNGYNQTIKDNERSILSATEARDEAAEAVNDIKNNKAATDAYADALAELSKEARAFVEYMVDKFIPALKELKAAAGEKLFPQLETALENLRTKLFPRLIPLLKGTGDVIGRIAVKFSEAVTKGENLERLERIWKSNDKVLTNFGDAATNLYEIFLILLDTARPLTEEFSKWIATVTGAYKETLNTKEGVEKLNDKFQIAKGILKDLGKIFGNVFGGLGKIISANVGPGSGGQIFLDYLKEVTGRFKNITEIDGRPLKDFFADAAENGTKLLSLLGNILGGFISMADNQGLGIFLDQLNVVTDIFQEVGENLDASLPAFGGFLIEFARFIELVTEAGSVTIFFNTLRTALEFLNNFLRSELGQRLLELSAQILPLLAAFGLIGMVAKFAFLVVLGGLVKLITPFITLGVVIYKAYKAFMGLQIVMLLGAGPVLAIVAAVAAVVAIIALLFIKSEKLREAFMLLVNGAFGALKGAFKDIMGAIESIMPSIKSVGALFESVGNFLAVTLVPILSFILVGAIGVLSGAIQRIIYVIGGIIEAFKSVWYFVKGIFQLLTGNTEGAADSMKKSFSAAFSAIKNAIKSILAPFVAVINAISDAWNNSVGKFSFTVPKWVPLIGGNTFKVPNLPRINLANFADGGIVAPREGGVIARVAEAGRAERIEPLDPTGLSVRDRAIIDRLSGGGKAVTVNVYPSEGMDERELASIVSRQIAFQLRKGAA